MAANETHTGAASEPLPISPKNVIRFTPSHYQEGDEKAPIYILAPPTPFLRADIRADLTRMGVTPVHKSQFRRALRQALPAFLEGEALATSLEDIDTVEAADVDLPEETSDLVQAIIRVEGLAMVAVVHSEEYAELSAQQTHWWDVYCILAARYALRGWENLPAKFVRRRRIVTDEALIGVPPQDLKAIGAKVVSLMHVSEDQRKN